MTKFSLNVFFWGGFFFFEIHKGMSSRNCMLLKAIGYIWLLLSGMSMRDLVLPFIYKNRYFTYFEFYPFLASFLKGCFPKLRGSAQFTILTYFEVYSPAIRTFYGRLWAQVTGQPTLIFLPPPFFQLLQAGEGHHLLQDPTLSWTLSSVPNFLFSQVPWWVSRSFSLPPQSGVNLLFTRVFDSFFIFPYEACYGAARPIFSHFSLCLSTSRSTI